MKRTIQLLIAASLLSSMMFAQSSGAKSSKNQAASQQDSVPALPTYSKDKSAPANQEERLAREVRHELVMQPYYTIWDWLSFRVHGSTVELLGDTVSTGLKSDAINSVKRIEGVENVVDHITEIPPFPSDDRIRRELARSIFSFGNLSRYSWSAVPSIHIIVNNGRVRLEGVVDSQSDKDAAGLRANQVPGVFAVTNNLRVSKS